MAATAEPDEGGSWGMEACKSKWSRLELGKGEEDDVSRAVLF